MSKRGHGEGSVRKRKHDGRWEARISIRDEHGKPKQVSRYFSWHADAIKGLAELRSEYQTAGNAETKRWDDFVKEYLAHIRANRAVATFRLYSSLVRHISPIALPPHTRLHAIRLKHIDDIMHLLEDFDFEGMRVTRKSPNHRRAVLFMLRKMLNFAIRRKYLTTNVAADVEPPRVTKKKRAILSREQAARLLAEAKTFRDGRYYELFVVALYTAMRQGEIFALTFANFDERKRTIRVEYTLTEGLDYKLDRTEPKTESSIRTLEIPNGAVKVLSALRRARKAQPSDFMFVDTEGKPLRKSNFRRDVYRPLLKAAGIPKTFTFHGLRHVANSFMLAEDGNVKAAQERLGHASSRMTLEVYTHVLPGHHRAAADRLDGLFDSPLGPHSGEGN